MTDVMEAPAKIGHNNPPDPFEAVKVHIEDLAIEAANWLDGSPVTSQAEADEVGKLLDMVRQAEKAADAARVEENKPHDEAKAAVQAKYAPLIANTKSMKGKTVLIAEACKAALAPWLKKLDDERRAEAQRLAAEAVERQRIAAEAARAAQASDLAAREDAVRLEREAAQAQAEATKAANSRAQAAGGARATALRSYWEPVLVNDVEASKHYWTTRREAFAELLMKLAREDVTAGKRTIPGFDVREDRRVV